MTKLDHWLYSDVIKALHVACTYRPLHFADLYLWGWGEGGIPKNGRNGTGLEKGVDFMSCGIEKGVERNYCPDNNNFMLHLI